MNQGIVHVLLFEARTDNEGIHSLEVQGKTVVLMFENKDDAERYCGLLEAQDFPKPSVEPIESEEIIKFCLEAGYEAKHVPKGFIPENEEDRLMLAPPELNRDVSNWSDEDIKTNQDEKYENLASDKLDEIRKKLEGLI